MKYYNVTEAFNILKENKITTNIESVRRWLRLGTIKGTKPLSRKQGWSIREDDLFQFIQSRLPENKISFPINTTNDVNGVNKEAIRAEMWWELANKYIFEDFIEPKKKQVQHCMEHLRMSKDFEKYVWKRISDQKLGYRTPRIPYLLDAFFFEGERILLDDNYGVLEDQILFALIEVLRKEKVSK